ncbi:MAG: lysine exporter LysO family protein [Thermoplasmata archaeon]|nr:lysine exporter LysO family protein [Thermoplasmata archaeon]
MALPIDPFLYVALALGFVAGRLLSLPARWLNAATVATVLVLIGLLGISLGTTPISQVIEVVPLALAAVGVILAVTVGLAWLLRPAGPATARSDASGTNRPWMGVAFLGVVIAGFALGHVVSLPVSESLRLSLYVLLALVGWGLVVSASKLRRLWVPLTAAVVGAIVGGVFLGLVYTSYPVGFAAAFGFGFYTLTGALVDARVGATIGFLAFLTNFLRENLTMVLSPWLGRRIRGEGLTAMGGATSMDTTLYFVTRFGDPDAATLALTSGLVLTVMATVLIPLFLALPGA